MLNYPFPYTWISISIMRLIFLFFSIITLSGCYQNKTLTDNTLVYCTASTPSSFNPQISHDIASLDASTHQLFNRLVKLDPKTNQFVPDLAESWVQSDDKLRYRFTLRHNISFHRTKFFQPSRYLNADDVIFSFNRMLDPKHPYHAINNPDQNYFYNFPFTHFLSAIYKIDDNTIEFVLSKPDVTLLANLAAHYAVIHSQEYAIQLLQRGHPERIDFYPIGTGPFKFKSATTNGTIRYQKNALYWQSMSNIENLIYVSNSSATKRYTKLLSGECDVISYPAASQLASMKRNKEVFVNSQSTANIALWAFNSKQDALKNNLVRIAISNAINKDTILKAVYFQSAVATNTLLSEQSWAFKPRLDYDEFNPALSKEQLQALNFDFNQELNILLPENSDVFNPDFHKTAELIQANLADIGIKTKIISLTSSALQARLLSGDYDTYLTGINIRVNDPDRVFRPLIGCDSSIENGNSSGWCSNKVQTLLDQALTEPDLSQRIKNYYAIQDEIYEQRPYLPLAHVLRLDALSKSILNVEVNPLTGINFQNAIKQDQN